MSGPITVEMLRGDWENNPNLTPEQEALLTALPDDVLEAAIDNAFSDYEDTWYRILDETRSIATSRLLEHHEPDDDTTHEREINP